MALDRSMPQSREIKIHDVWEALTSEFLLSVSDSSSDHLFFKALDVEGEDHLNVEDPTSFFPTTSPFNITPLFTAASSAAALSVAAPNVAATTDAAVDDIDIDPVGFNFLEEKVEASDYSTEDSVESEGELDGDDDEEEYGSDVHEKRNERVPAENAKVPVGEAGPVLAFDETETVKRHTMCTWCGCTIVQETPSAPTIFPAFCSAPSDYCVSSLMSGTTKRGRGNDREKAAPLKRSKVMGMSVFQAENGFKVLNPVMPSNKIYSTGQARVTRSADIAGNISYTPSTINKLK
ncbi:putative F-box protein-like [Capsicum annuum]|nr:putative F-box protein-like [Capsicum annuum]